MRTTKAEMDRRCAAFLALEPYGAYLRAEREVQADLEQPLLRLAEVVAVADLVGPGPQTARFLADVDRLCFPELLRALSAAAFDELEAHVRELLPGVRTFVHDDDGDEPPPPPPEERAGRAPSFPGAFGRAASSTRSAGAPAAADVLDAGLDDAGALEAGAATPAETERRDGGDGAAAADSVFSRCLLKCAPELSVKKTTRMAAKVDGYERLKGAGNYPYAAFIGDSLRASVVCDDAEAFWKTYRALRGDPDDPRRSLKILRLKNKLGKRQEPFNFHLNCSFQPTTFKAPIQLEIQIWAAEIMALNDVSHWQYEVSRAGDVAAW